jgi:hypothetical protein
VTADGRLFSFGYGDALGHAKAQNLHSSGAFEDEDEDEDAEDILIPKLVEFNLFPKIHSERTIKITAVAAGNRHSMALSDEGQLWTFGSGALGQLGHGDTDEKRTPTKVLFSSCSRGGGQAWGGADAEEVRMVALVVVGIAAGAVHSLAITVGVGGSGNDSSSPTRGAGRLWSWGEGSDGQLGHGDQEAELRPKLIRFRPQDCQKMQRQRQQQGAGAGQQQGAGAENFVDGIRQEHARGARARGSSIISVSSISVSSISVSTNVAVVQGAKGASGVVGVVDETDYLVEIVHCSAGGTHSLAVSSTGVLFSFGGRQGGQLGLAPPSTVHTTSSNADDGSGLAARTAGNPLQSRSRRIRASRWELLPQPVATSAQVGSATQEAQGTCARLDGGSAEHRVVAVAAGPGASVVVAEDGTILTFGSGVAAAVHGASGGYMHIATPRRVATPCADGQNAGGGADGGGAGATGQWPVAIRASVPTTLRIGGADR